MRLSDKQRKLLILAFDPSASIGETMAALRAVFAIGSELIPMDIH
jgi:hypothetical protein